MGKKKFLGFFGRKSTGENAPEAAGGAGPGGNATGAAEAIGATTATAATAATATATVATDGAAAIPAGELVAIFAAAIAHASGAGAQPFRVVSFRRTNMESPIWNRRGRIEYLSGKL